MKGPIQLTVPLLTAAFALLAVPSAMSDDGLPRATGFIPSPMGHTLRACKMENTKRGALLRATADALPSKWDSRERGWITPVRDQEELNTCWAFVALATIETQLLKSGRGTWDLSEKNMVNHRAIAVHYNAGAFANTAAGYLLRWSGPVLEAYDVYVGNSNDWPRYPSPALTPALHVQEVVWVPPLDGTAASRTTYKAAIREYGAVATVIGWYNQYESGANYYCYKVENLNHAITVIGWDDDYKASNFARTPSGNGAWIIKNSWGTGNGDNGFYYVSYYDKTFAKVENGSVYIPAEEDTSYDTVHGYDRGGPLYDASNPDDMTTPFSNDRQAVVLTAAAGERLAAVGVWTRLSPKPYEITIYTNVTRGTDSPIAGGVLALTQAGTLMRPGYTLIPLSTEIPLVANTNYAIVYRQTGSEPRSSVVAAELAYADDPVYGRSDYTYGNGYIGWTDESTGSITWQDAVEAGRNDGTGWANRGWALCIKAYTRNAVTAPASEMPGATEDGTAMLADLESRYSSTLFYETFAFGPLARLVGANGHSLWARWLTTGFDPAIPESQDFTVSLDMSGGSPRISWEPNLGDSNRTYTVWGRDSLAPEDTWRTVDRNNPAATGARFFRVTVEQ